MTQDEVVRFFNECGDIIEAGEDIFQGSIIKGFGKILQSANYVRKNADVAISTYKSYPPETQEIVHARFKTEFDLSNDRLEVAVENIAFKAVEMADWIIKGLSLVPQIIGIASLKGLFTKK